jgi:hypothetical protein
MKPTGIGTMKFTDMWYNGSYSSGYFGYRNEKGDIIVIPLGYGYVTINPTADQTLAMANLVLTAFSSNYRWYETMHGAAYYELTGGVVQKNPAYPDVPPVWRVRNIRSPLNNFLDWGYFIRFCGEWPDRPTAESSGKLPGFFVGSIQCGMNWWKPFKGTVNS